MKQEHYLDSLRPETSEKVKEMEVYAKEYNVPIMEPLGIDFLMQLVRMHSPKKILEIGAAIGYSAIRMAEADSDSQIVTVERDSARYEEACKNIGEFQLEQRVKILHGDALELREKIAEDGPYDMLFIDAAKGKYEEFFNLYAPLLTEKGAIISDNVLFKGYVADDEHATKRMAKIAGKIRTFNEWLANHPDYHTTIVPIGDGIAITVKK
ncbi:O-methyltransferase [Halobacillus yeomjeoni]|uniref:O-methyltransferase n=1 Tax=Halobacillus yeomjeoni TaxID=311194 RepID=UPI001CD6DC8A|nr:O-methyltransferase [Halobacillus yeomjeoni]MCA0982661.1 O-methyltransferase [Halobacillus yeomjeoni]